ncbi:MAG TPA: IS110 family transposase [Candidatus Sulfotelmatobacter sp.]|nr:IS110 family transposase [Candidatus Sulfotelmatobacter sp.]
MYSYFVGLDVHKQVIAYCIKKVDGEIVREGKIEARREALDEWVQRMPGAWRGGMEATLFSHWIYRHLKPYAEELLMGNPARMKAICAGKKKSDKLDARTLADLLRCNLFPACYVIAPELEGLRRQLRFRRRLVEETVSFKNKTAGLLLEVGVEYERRRLHGKHYFGELLETSAYIDEELRPLLEFNRRQIEALQKMDQRLMRTLEQHPRLRARVAALQQIDSVGPVTALTWALEVGHPERFPSIKKAVSYCGLTSALHESAGKQKRGPLSKQRNPHLQSVLIETAKLAPLYHSGLAELYRKESQIGHSNRATLEVARKLVAYLLAADRAFFTSQTA